MDSATLNYGTVSQRLAKSGVRTDSALLICMFYLTACKLGRRRMPATCQGIDATWPPQGFMPETSIVESGVSSVLSASSLQVHAQPSTE